mmetsp:Transcript_37146/g.41901  ORF Transcript_37146/g.41901 Transcript_37146/m.41901 type:complete len:132 (-) Transcript_37146:711-1106(-)
MVRVIRPVAVVVFWKREMRNPLKKWTIQQRRLPLQVLRLQMLLLVVLALTLFTPVSSTWTGIDSTKYTFQPPPPPVVDVDDDSVLTSSSTDNISTTEYTVEPMVDIDDDDTDDLVVVPSTDTDGRPMQPIV